MRLAVFPGTFNPPTRAHLALIEAAGRISDEVMAILPRNLPHKSWDGATLEERVAMLEAARRDASFSVAVTEGGLFIDIARELRRSRPAAEIWVVCGSDAAKRILEWDYGTPGAIDLMLEEFGLLVADRLCSYEPPAKMAHRVEQLAVPPEIVTISATEVRERLASGDAWEHLVPPAAVPLISQVYARRPWQSK